MGNHRTKDSSMNTYLLNLNLTLKVKTKLSLEELNKVIQSSGIDIFTSDLLYDGKHHCNKCIDLANVDIEITKTEDITNKGTQS